MDSLRVIVWLYVKHDENHLDMGNWSTDIQWQESWQDPELRLIPRAYTS